MCTVGKEKYCEIPNVGTEGGNIIRDLDGKVLGLKEDLTIAEWEIKTGDRPNQIWERSPFDTKNYFTLKNKDTTKMLHGLRGAYKGNRLNNGQPNMQSKDLVYFSKKHTLILTKITFPQLPFGNLKTKNSQTKMTTY